jgi:tryptophanyl-tRNA synthetase
MYLLTGDQNATNLLYVIEVIFFQPYRATHVPVGEDQTQHLELCRELAESFNRKFSPLFPIPTQVDSSYFFLLQ